MATNVLELRRLDQDSHASDPLDELTIKTIADVGYAATALDRQSRSHGLRVMVWHDLASMDEMIDGEGRLLNPDIFGWNDDQLEPFRDIQKAFRSPMLRACRVEGEPFLISPRGIRSRWANHYLSMIDLDDFELISSVHSAIVIPVHLPFGQIATAIFTSADPTLSDVSRQFSQIGDHLGVRARRFISGYVKISSDRRYLPTEHALTVRQIECLRWAALGKTDYEIGIILGCSHAGVRYHISSACLRLGAANRTQSVFRACQLGYLSQSC
jgi:DNA-binding CsgD family transcriptional regulator